MTESRLEFFDRIADKWDGWADLDRMRPALRAGLAELGIEPFASVLDLGCGTGNLTLALLEQLDDHGRITSVDLSANMIEQAKHKVSDHRVRWVIADAVSMPIDDSSIDHAICFSAWPHFPEPAKVLKEVRRVLKSGGTFAIWHAISKEAVNAIHRDASPAVETDLLAPAAEVAVLLRNEGFAILVQVDDPDRYLIHARLTGS